MYETPASTAVDAPPPVRPHNVDYFRCDVGRRLLFALLPPLIPTVVGALIVMGAAIHVEAREPWRAYATHPSIVLTAPPPGHPEALDPTTGKLTAQERLAFSLGLVLIMLGPVWMLLALRGLMGDDDFVMLRTDGLQYHFGDANGVVDWDDVEAVVYDEGEGAIRLERRHDAPFFLRRRFAGIDPPALAKRMEEVRRKAIWHLLPAQR
ncbi:MAG: hypothetical protein KC543_03450 [Myxococcales bacterium]|nr:hypothetical protein [Myxococcales bacterium]